MRPLADCNPKKRGCLLCADMIKVPSLHDKAFQSKACPYNKCPYHELDDFKTYADYDRHAKKEGQRQMESWLKKVFELSEK